ncbi:hypothetical protein IFM46972_02363 [Aspergillus udagawae]|uniref:Uncharacterized protein n=1 Tax=Aspergillus udagawae TaxID=91492 RepID=A0A8H3N7M1_9EURO|nr:hypothetical protein IFM46972_02363 [Aspergillus udagawae]
MDDEAQTRVFNGLFMTASTCIRQSNRDRCATDISFHRPHSSPYVLIEQRQLLCSYAYDFIIRRSAS